MTFTNLTFALLSFFATGNDKIENGQTIPIDNSIHRSVVLYSSNRGLCSATFITPRFLITAAHCTSKTTAAQSKIRVRGADQRVYQVAAKRLITHPSFQLVKTPSGGTRVRNDIALIELANDVPVPVVPVRIGTVSEFLNEERPVSIYGYGKNSNFGGAGTLRWGRMIATVMKLNSFMGREGLAMAPEVDQALCPGDSGGAVMKIVNSRRMLIGVNSLSNGCQNAPLTASKAEIVASFLPWIRQHVSGI